jgi:hypothetical protein
MSTRSVIAGQYRAALAMLEQTIAACPEPLWLDRTPRNAFWHIAYHTLFYTHLYAQDSEAAFVPWPKHREQCQFLGPLPWPPHALPAIGEPYHRSEVLEYLAVCRDEVSRRVATVDLEAAVSGFDWLPFGKLELQLYNIRHVQHHTGQLIDRLAARTRAGIAWVGSMSDQDRSAARRADA